MDYQGNATAKDQLALARAKLDEIRKLRLTCDRVAEQARTDRGVSSQPPGRGTPPHAARRSSENAEFTRKLLALAPLGELKGTGLSLRLKTKQTELMRLLPLLGPCHGEAAKLHREVRQIEDQITLELDLITGWHSTVLEALNRVGGSYTSFISVLTNRASRRRPLGARM